MAMQVETQKTVQSLQRSSEGRRWQEEWFLFTFSHFTSLETHVMNPEAKTRDALAADYSARMASLLLWGGGKGGVVLALIPNSCQVVLTRTRVPVVLLSLCR